MAWKRRPPEVVGPPEPLSMTRWLGAALLALLAGIALFVLAVSGRVPELGNLNVWMLAAAPLLLWALAFGVRAYVYGGALNHFRFLEDQAAEAEGAWGEWAQRNLAVQSSCVLLPDKVSAAVIAQEAAAGAPRRSGEARRIDTLPAAGDERMKGALEQLLRGVIPALAALPGEQVLQVTVLSDVEENHRDALCAAWQRVWSKAAPRYSQVAPTLVDELSLQWVESCLKSPGTAVDLLVVMQINGKDAYSDGLAALLLCPDSVAIERELPVHGRLLRPMPLDVDQLDAELPLFLQTQSAARRATGILADSEQWQAVIGAALSVGGAHGANFQVGQQRIQESLCGLPGPFSSWLLAALGLELSRHLQQALVVLSEEPSQRWIGTVATGELA
ncbi:hypothetical protein [Pseudomonas citronellolis]|uniref:hypothetical protein n=1 Tax=Pseudomonas citronellolis TaxID=53408 RepID=UPI0023E3C9E1|nr:hypothetical protein [Pseudomonas citronellolis]MDF3931169.1 hypothetical protein [Pseudomonas citronellolis]